MTDGRQKARSILKPLREPLFRSIAIANVVSMIGTLMHDVGAAWLMTTLAPTPFMVALVQTASTGAFFLLALPAGALADIFDRRQLLIWAQVAMLFLSFLLGILTLWNLTTPLILLLFTFLLALFAAANGPAWHATIPELVERKDLAAAIALGSVGFNIARALGPVIGGAVVAARGPEATFFLNALSYLGIVMVLKRWKRPREDRTLPEERFLAALRAGLRYVRHAPEVKAVLIHSVYPALFGSVIWALLPIIARREAGFSSMGYGALLGFFGFGAIGGATVLTYVKRRFSLNLLVLLTSCCFAASICFMGFTLTFAGLAWAMTMAGMAWLLQISSLLASVQSVIPAWVRGRVLSVHMVIFFGALAGGSLLSGISASFVGTRATLVAASCLLAGSAFLFRSRRLVSGEDMDLTPSLHWPSIALARTPGLEDGPVLIVVEYDIDPGRVPEFLEAVADLKTVRKRDGAIRWNLFHDLDDGGHYVESFIVESWGEHLRQHERITVVDREKEQRVLSFHQGVEPPRVMHYLSQPVTSGGIRKREDR